MTNTTIAMRVTNPMMKMHRCLSSSVETKSHPHASGMGIARVLDLSASCSGGFVMAKCGPAELV